MTSPRPIHAELLGHAFRFEAAPGLFSADRVDDGTKLLLAHLPPRAPASVLDLGCGYGALGLPVAATYPDARVLLVDRDVLAAEYSGRNALSHRLRNVVAKPSLGYRDLGGERFDWVLCNVPARIGDEAIAYLVGGGAARLTDAGELRIVVIRDLGPIVERVAAERRWPVERSAEGPRHLVYALRPRAVDLPDHETLYRRDAVRLAIGPETLEFERPHDINEDLPHLREGVPLLLECLPKSAAATTWRAGYGPVPVALARRGAEVVAADRDLLALTFVRRNAGRHGQTIRIVESPHFRADSAPSLIVGELYANVGSDLLSEELAASQQALAKGGQALWLGLAKVVKELLAKNPKLGATVLATRGSYAVLRLAARAK